MKTMTLELPDDVYEAVRRSAQESHQQPAEWVAARVRSLVPPQASLTPEEYAAARARLERHFGVVCTGDPDSANNERIDADLMREYADSHGSES